MSGRLNIICIDDSEFSENGFNWYVSHHHRPEDTVGLVHVHQTPSLPLASLMSGNVFTVPQDFETSVETSTKKAWGIIEKYENLCKENNIPCKYFIVNDNRSPGYAICHVAKEKSADTIIMGQRGLSGISRRLLGSTSDYVLHHAHVPVIVVPAKKKEHKHNKSGDYTKFE